MRQHLKKTVDKVLAIVLSLMMVVAVMPLNAFAVDGISSVLSTDIEDKNFSVGVPTEFTFTTTANDDYNKMVVGTFVFSDPDAITKLEYKESKDGNWYEFYGDFGPSGGFPMIDGTSTFRVTFGKAGDYNVVASMKDVTDGTILCSVSADITVKGKAGTISTDIGDKVFNVGEYTEFSFATTANDDYGTMVKGGFDFSDPDAIERLEYKESKDGNWYQFYGEFGPAEGFPMIDGVSYFRAIFNKAGNYEVNAYIKSVEDGSVLCSVSSEVKVEHKVTVSAPKADGGKILLNNSESDSAVVDFGTNVDVQAVADPGYQIKSVSIDGASQDLGENKNTFATTLNSVSADTKIDVVFVKVYTVTISYDGNGKVETSSEIENGTVTVETGSKLKISAVPDVGHHVESVVVNDEPMEVSGANDSGYECTLNIDKEYKINVTFAPNVYSVTAADTDNGSVTVENQKVKYNESTKVVLKPDAGYTVASVQIGDVKVNNIVKDSNGEISFVIDKITEDKNIEVLFKEISKASKNDMSINFDSALRSDEQETLFVIKSGDEITFSTEKTGIRLFDKDGALLGGDASTQSVPISGADIARIELYYQAADEYYADWHVVETDPISVVADYGDNVTASISADREPNENGYYNSDVTLYVSAEDTGIYSGVGNIEYYITVNGEEGQSVNLYKYNNGDEILNTVSKEIKIDSSIYNAKEVKITLIVTDRAGNEKTVEKTLNINSTAPSVSLDINGTMNTNAQNGYYNDERTLTLVVNDREDTFSAENAAKGLKIKLNGKELSVSANDIVWNKQDDGFVGEYTFAEDGHYEWSFSYTNLAGMSNQGITAPQDKNIYDFYIDKAEPYDLSVTYKTGFISELIKNVTFGFFNPAVEVEISAKDVTSGIQEFRYSYIDEAGSNSVVDQVVNSDIKYSDGVSYVTFEIPAQFRGNVSFSATDNAGRTAQLIDDEVVIVDTIAPGITVEYDNNDAYNGNYYNADRTATIKINEANFFYEDVEDGHLVIERTKVLNDGTRTTENLKPEFKEENGYYVAEVLFNENADYTFDIKYTDRAGNVYDSYPADEFTIDKINPVIEVSYDNNECINGNQFDRIRTATIKVTEHNFNDKGITALVNGSEYNLNWDSVQDEADTYSATVTFPGDQQYTFSVSGKDLANNGNDSVDATDSVAPWEFTVDCSGPDRESMKITYQPDFVGVLLQNLTFGFYKADLNVTIEATDEISGIDYFEYSYSVQDGASSVNQGKENVKVDVDGKTASTTFTIPAQFRGFVSFIAVNNAGVGTSYADQNAVVVDTIAPGVTVEYDNNNYVNNNYYNSSRTATIKIEEANFFAEDIEDGHLVITQTKELNNGAYTEENLKPEFTKDGDVYTAKVVFNENADYTFDIKYTDRAGNVYDSYETDSFTVDNIKPQISIEKANGAYFNEDRQAKITVVEHNFRPSDFNFAAEAFDVTGKNQIDLISADLTAYLKNPENWVEVEPDTWEAVVNFNIEGNYRISATYSDLAGNAQASEISDTFCVDKSDPANLSISYKSRFIDVVLETVTFGFYKSSVEVTIEATDDYSGVDYFVYSYLVEAGASTTNSGKSNVKAKAVVQEDTNRAYAVFTIPEQFRGNVSFTAYDKASNSSYKKDGNVLVIDNVAPGVSVSYDNNNAVNGSFYRANRTATVKITEANFFGTEEWNYADIKDGNLVITVGKTLNDGTYTSEVVTPQFTKNGDVYTADILFDENADYTFDIKYTDRSGNVYDSYEADKFTIDKIAPKISVSYNDAQAKYENGNQFRTNRTATIQITEHNFRASDVAVAVTASGSKIADYAIYLANDANWSHNGDVHTAVIQYTDEAHYTFDIGYTDLAGNVNNGVNYGKSVAPTAFTLDKSAPTDMDITIDNKSVAGSMNTIAYDTFYDSAVTIKLSANFDISGKQSVKYQKVSDVADYNANGNWVDYDSQTGIVVYPNEKFVIYFRAEDRAGNVRIIRSTGIVVDNQKPIGEINAPEIDILPSAPNENGIHSGDVRVDLKVVDPKYAGLQTNSNGYYSGLNNITYKIYTTDTNAVEEGVLLNLNGVTSGAVFDDDNLISSWSGEITIDADKFNSNNVIVQVTASDNSGNTRTTTTLAGEIKIDITAPTIEVSYDNNDADSSSYFNANRTATIVITERNFNRNDIDVRITNTDGSAPSVSAWSRIAGSGNGDDTQWKATVNYSSDGDYEFSIAFTDLAGRTCSANEVDYGDSVAPTRFTIDKTNPLVSVSYDNNSAVNKNYYNAERVATVVITEHNLDPNGADRNRINITLTATDDGNAIAVPSVSRWTSNGDKHTATIRFSSDALYTVDVDITDKAGNVSADFAEQTFYVDKTNPTLEITGVANNSANKGDVIPVVSYSDTNYDADQVTITLEGANRNRVELDGVYSDIHNGRIFTFNNFEEEPEIDDIYTLSASVTDKAGNNTTQMIVFSVNRFGSTYSLSEAASRINGTYIQSPEDIVITETNADELSNIVITVFKDGEARILTEGDDYIIDVEGGNGSWYHYVYTIFAKNFAADGVYSITIESDDAAGNNAKNDLDTKDTEISFGVDGTLPIINIENLESNTTYATDSLTVNMSIEDNLKLAEVIVVLDGVEIKRWTLDELEEIVRNGGNFSFEVPGDSTSAHNLVVYAVDAAGNGAKAGTEIPDNAQEVSNFYVTTNLWVRFYTNRLLFFGTIAAVVVVAGFIIFLIVRKRKKDEEKEQNAKK